MRIPKEYEVTDKLVISDQFCLYRVKEVKTGNLLLLKAFENPTEKQVQSLMNGVQLLKEKDWLEVLKPIDVFIADQELFITYRNEPGITLQQFILEKKKLKPPEFIKMSILLVKSVAAVHTARWIISTLCPQYFLVDPNNLTAHIIDLRKASKILNKETADLLSSYDLDYIQYISPEQTGRVNKPIDFRSDYYSLGVIFYEMLTGMPPFMMADMGELIHCHIARQPIALNTKNPYISQILNDIVLKLLDKNPAERYQSWKGLLADLEEAENYLEDNIYRISEFKLGTHDYVNEISLSGKLIGRGSELELMKDLYSLSLQGKRQILYIGGYSGVGKTRLVQEFEFLHIDSTTFVAAAKFDVLQRNTPYAAVITAIRKVIRLLLREDDNKLAYWKTRLLFFLQGNGQIITNVIPELETIIGKQDIVEELPPDEAQNRFNSTFKGFFSAFSTEQHSLVLFLDDLQWADLGSLKLIELLVTDIEIKNLFFIGAYRENEIDPTHPFSISLQYQKQKVYVYELLLPSLNINATREFIQDTLHNTVENENRLVEDIFKKTEGNIFFTIQLIKSLNESGILFKNEFGRWQWNETALVEYSAADNVVEFLIQKINNLLPDSKKILQIGASIGDIFDLRTISYLLGERLYTVAYKLAEIINIGYLFSQDESLDHYLRSSENVRDVDLNTLGNVRFRFAHDRIRQACLSMMGDDELALINLSAGRYKLETCKDAEIEDDIFLIANHFIKGEKYLNGTKDIQYLVETTVRAGRKALAASAYDSAIQFFNAGRRYSNFKETYNTLYNLQINLATCKYLTGAYSAAEEDLNELLHESKTKLDSLEVLILKVYLYTSNDQKEKAIDAASNGFKLYGVHMPRKKYSIMFSLVLLLIQARWLLFGKAIEDIPKGRITKDPEQIRLLEFMHAVSPPMYQCDQNLFAWDIMKLVNYSLKFGNNGVAPFGYIGYGMILSQLFGDYKTGKRLADVSIQLNNELSYAKSRWKLRMIYQNFVQHWTGQIRPEFENILDNINGCIADGDPRYAGYAIFHYHQKKFALGFPLKEVKNSIENYFIQVAQRGDIETHHYLEPYYQAMKCLEGEEDNILLLGNVYNAPEKITQIIKSYSFSIAADIYIAYIMVLYFFHFYDEAWKRYLESEKYVEFVFHRYEYAEYCFFGGLICARAYEKKLQPSRPYLRLLKAHLKKLKLWHTLVPNNFEPQYLLLEAELARLTGNKDNTASLYEKAIKSADIYQFTNYKALANELAGRYHFNAENLIIAKTYLENARQSYKHWGAIGKVKDIENEFSKLLGEGILLESKASSDKNSYFDKMELNFVLNSATAVQSEKDIDQLIEKLMLVIVRNSGADSACLLLKVNSELVVKGLYTTEKGFSSVTEYQDPEILPINIIKYTARLKEPLIINSPAKEAEYRLVQYYITHHPLSVLIYPILKQGEVFGVLYLENYLNEGVFDGSRINLLNLISVQMAILLDNAYLYKNMESLVNEKTVILETEKGKIDNLLKNILPREAIEELKTTGKTTPQRLENVTVLMADIKGFTKISEKLTPEELIEKIDSYFRAFDDIIVKHGLEKIKTIGDAYMAIGGVGKTKFNGAEKVILAAFDMNEFVMSQFSSTGDDRIELRIGIHTGVVIAGVVGSTKLQYDIWGDTVNVAARMEQNSEPSKVNISEVTYNLVRNKFSFYNRGKIEAKNKGELVMYFVEPLQVSL